MTFLSQLGRQIAYSGLMILFLSGWRRQRPPCQHRLLSLQQQLVSLFLFQLESSKKKQKTKKIIVTTSLLEVLEKVRFYRALSGISRITLLDKHFSLLKYLSTGNSVINLLFHFNSIWLSISGNIGNDCNFDVGICKWTFASYGQFNWTRHQGSTASSGTGPKYDHTRGNSGTCSSHV